jgi:NADP-reducing hydrogenase subunit HndD
MACPGGCVNGGGQPVQNATVRSTVDLKAKRAAVLYNSDAANTIRCSHDNPVVKKLYDEFLEKPGSHVAHEILHTYYIKRGL